MKRDAKKGVSTGAKAGTKRATKTVAAKATPAVKVGNRKTAASKGQDASNKTAPTPSAKPAVKAGSTKPKGSPPKAVKAAPAKPIRAGTREVKAETPRRKTVRPRKAAARKQLSIPPILLEGDVPPPPPVSGPGTRYALTPETIVAQVAAPGGELPESYGTKNLFLTARDPHWLFASWDLTQAQQQEFNKRSRDGHLVLRVFANDEPELAVPEQHVHPESRSWFIHVPRAETRYRAELGFYEAAGSERAGSPRQQWNWFLIAVSRSTFTPPDAPSPELATDFATIPQTVTFEEIVNVVQDFARGSEPLMEAVIRASAAPPREEPRQSEPLPVEPPRSETIQVEPRQTDRRAEIPKSETEEWKPRASAAPERPSPTLTPTVVHAPEPPNRVRPSRSFRAEIPVRIETRKDWTPAQARELAKLISIDAYRRVWMGSMEITELVRRHLQEEAAASIAVADLVRGQLPRPDISHRVEAPSSMPGREIQVPSGRDFWFKVNAELIIYGATRPDARVTIAGRPIKLRSDGTFSFRFSLPDGRYQLPAVAVSRDGGDGREARLEFSRNTDYRGHVEPLPQDAGLRPPRPENVA